MGGLIDFLHSLLSYVMCNLKGTERWAACVDKLGYESLVCRCVSSSSLTWTWRTGVGGFWRRRKGSHSRDKEGKKHHTLNMCFRQKRDKEEITAPSRIPFRCGKRENGWQAATKKKRKRKRSTCSLRGQNDCGKSFSILLSSIAVPVVHVRQACARTPIRSLDGRAGRLTKGDAGDH